MIPGQELLDFEVNLKQARANVNRVKSDVTNMKETVQNTIYSLETAGRLEQQADQFGDKIEQLRLVLKVVEKYKPLKFLAEALDEGLRLLGVASKRIEAKADQIDDKIKSAKIGDKNILETLKEAEEKLEGYEDSLTEKANSLKSVEESSKKTAESFESLEEFLGPQYVQGFSDVADIYVTVPNDALELLNGTFADIEDELDTFRGLVDAADFLPVAQIAKVHTQIDNAIGFLCDVLEVAHGGLKPIEGLLDAVGLVFDLTVGPVIDWLLEEIGLKDVMRAIGRELEKLLPDPDILDSVLANFDIAFQASFDFLETGFGIGDWLDDFQTDVINPFTNPQDGPFGIDLLGNNTLLGDNGNDLLAGLSGDDFIDGAGGINIILAGEGDDTITGAISQDDILAFSGFFTQYAYSQTEEGGPVVFRHVVQASGEADEGTETLSDIEYVLFARSIYSVETLIENTKTSAGSTLDGTAKDDLLFGTGGQITIDGKGGNDRISGSNSNDLLFGKGGNDILIGNGGADQIFGGKGADTYLFAYEINSTRAIVVDLAAGTAVTGSVTDTLVGVENAEIQDDRAATLFGTEGANALSGSSRNDHLDGRGGDDRLIGGGGNDLIVGGAGSDVAIGGAGNDYFLTGGPAVSGDSNSFTGGEGTDFMIYAEDADDWVNDSHHPDPPLQPGSGPLTIYAGDGRVDRLNQSGAVVASDFFAEVEVLVGSDDGDTLFGAPGPDDYLTIAGAGGNDTLYSGGAGLSDGGDGDDVLFATLPGDGVYRYMGFDGGNGFDVLDLTQIEDVRWAIRLDGAIGSRMQALQDIDSTDLTSDDNDPIVTATALFSANVDGIDFYRLGNDDDNFQISNRDPSSTVMGGAGDDRIVAGSGVGGSHSEFHGQGGDDFLRLESRGTLFGGGGNDRLEVQGALSGYSVDGGAGDDILQLGRLVGAVEGGAGFDTIILQPSNNISEVVTDYRNGTITTSGGSGQINVTFSGVEQVIGADAVNDDMYGTDLGREQLIGRGAQDVLYGGGERDELFGGDGQDRLYGDDGDDVLHGGDDDDQLYGGAGNDTASWAFDTPGGRGFGTQGEYTGPVEANLITGRARQGGDQDILSGIENLTGGNAGDTLIGDGGVNILIGNGGDDTLYGGEGDDILVLGTGDDRAYAGLGDDTVIFDEGEATIYGGEGSDTLDFGNVTGKITFTYSESEFAAATYVATLDVERPVWEDTGGSEVRLFDGQSLTPTSVMEANPLYANSADDFTRRLPGTPDPLRDMFQISFETVQVTYTGEIFMVENIIGGTATNLLVASMGVDSFDGTDSDGDLLDLSGFGSEVTYRMATGASNQMALQGDSFTGLDGLVGSGFGDKLIGDGTRNMIEAGAGADIIKGGGGKDDLSGQGGADEVLGNGGADNLQGGGGKDTVKGGNGDDTASGGGGKDAVFGNDGNDRLLGGKGADELLGGKGDDILKGQNGQDFLDGGSGDDVLTGGGGADTFAFAKGGNRDLVTDFARGVDTLQLSSDLWTGDLNRQQVIDRFATKVDGNVVFDFGRHEITIDGIAKADNLRTDMEIV